MGKRAVDLEQMTLINELTQGRELASQLKNHIDPRVPPEACDFLLEKILSSYDKAISILKFSASLAEPLPPAGMLDSPHSGAGSSPRSEGSKLDFKDHVPMDALKKRKTLPRWSQQVRVCSGTKLDGPLDDGYSWRKYGQKDILGASFPRAYYRCTHRNAQGCLATKQVQRSGNEPSIFEVTYIGRHTCIQAPRSQGKKMLKQKIQHEEEESSERSPDTLANSSFEAGDLGSIPDEIFPSFYFPSTPMESQNVDNIFFKDVNFLDGYSPSFASPSATEYYYFKELPGEISDLGIGHNLLSSNSNSPKEDLDFLLEQEDIDPNLHIDLLEFA